MIPVTLSKGTAVRRPSASLVISSLALVVATGGTSYAAVRISGQDIENGTVATADLKDGDVRSRDVKDGTLKAKDFTGGQLAAGPRGERGPAGVGRWALVDATGQIVEQSGGFSVASRYDAAPGTPPGAVGNVYIDAHEDLTDNGIVATIALQNKVDQNGDGILNGRAPAGDANPEFSGEVTATRCGITDVVACAPAGTDNSEHLVVSPRLSDGQVTTSTTRKRFYVVVTGDSSDYLAPAS